jgi:hypothetical protein
MLSSVALARGGGRAIALAFAFGLGVSFGVGCGEEGGGGAGGGVSDTGGDARADTGRPPHTPPSALAALVALEELTDRSTLEVVIERERSGRVPGDFAEPIWQIGLTFRSQTFLGEPWRHSATLVLPDDLSRATGDVAIVQRGTPNAVEGISDPSSFLPQFAALTADRLDMPVLLLGDVPPAVDLRRDAGLASELADDFPTCFAGPLSDEKVLAECLWDVAEASRRPELFPALPVAVVYVRAMTLMEELAERVPTLDLPFTPPTFRAERGAALASGLGGLALRYALALDGRLEAVMAASADLGDLDDYFAAQQARWTAGFAYGDPSRRLAFLASEPGRAFSNAFDLSRIAVALRGRTYVAAIGTNDAMSPLALWPEYELLLPTERRALYVAGAEEGLGTLDHLLAWRVLLAHTFRGREWADIESRFVDDGGNLTVTATIAGNTLLQTVELHFVQRHRLVDDVDFRDAVWQRVPMADGGDGTWTAGFARTATHAAFFVRVLDSQDIYEGPMTGPLHLLTPP